MKIPELSLKTSELGSYIAIVSNFGNIKVVDNEELNEIFEIDSINNATFLDDQIFCAYTYKKIHIIDLKTSERQTLEHNLDIIDIRSLDEKVVILHKEKDHIELSLFTFKDQSLKLEHRFNYNPDLHFFKIIKIGPKVIVQCDHIKKEEYQFFELHEDDEGFHLKPLHFIDSSLALKPAGSSAIVYLNKKLQTFDLESYELNDLKVESSFNFKVIQDIDHKILISQMDEDAIPYTKYTVYSLGEKAAHLGLIKVQDLNPTFIISSDALYHIYLNDSGELIKDHLIDIPS